jgi:lipid II:glycine glycyltransferase (peptidoglycan interpeptide bridge formation enzyme)
MNLVYIDQSRQLEWERLTKTNPTSGYMQSFFWTKFKNVLGWQSYKIGITEHSTLVGGAIISKYSHLKGRNFLQISEGPVLPYGDPTKAAKMFELLICEIDTIADLSGDSLTSHLSIEPKLSHVPLYFSKLRKAPVDQQPVRTLLIDLRESEEELLREMKPKGRYNINVAKKHRVDITKMPLQEGVNDFLALYKPFVKQSGFEGKKDDYFLYLASLVPSMKEAALFVATRDKQLLSCAIVLYYGDTATFLYGASSYDDRNLMAPYLLHWEIIRDARKRGFTWYDFYSLAPGDGAVSHPWYGFSVFKRKFGGVEVNYIGGYDFVYNEEVYRRYLREDVGIKT